jgi:hypothetical protein
MEANMQDFLIFTNYFVISAKLIPGSSPGSGGRVSSQRRLVPRPPPQAAQPGFKRKWEKKAGV